MDLLNRRDFEKFVVGLFATSISGCGNFFKTDFIKKTATEIMEAEKSIFEKYKSETEVIIEKYPPREEEPFWSLSEEGIYTLYYKTAYANPSDLEKIIKEQFAEATVSTQTNLNQFIIKLKNESQKKGLEELLYNIDRIPDHAQIKLEICGKLGNITEDYSSELDLLYKNQEDNYNSAVTAESLIPGAEPRVIARGSMINRWGLELESEDFKLQAFIDVLKSHGFVKTLYQTEMLVPNNKKQMLGEEEKLLIPAYILSGVMPVKTYNLADVTSSVEINSIIHDGLVETTLQAVIGGSKRPNVRERIMVPVKDTANINGVYLKIGQPYSLAGKTKNMEIGIVRKDPFLPWPSGQDYENIVTSIIYTVTPRKVITYDPQTLVRPKYPIIKADSNSTEVL